MKILAHRGIWRSNSEKNSMQSLKQALDKGYGIETDFRDYCGEIVISHNIANDRCGSAEDLFSYYASIKSDSFIALNVKADGIQEKMKMLLNKYKVNNYFFFDMSIPEMVVCRRMGLIFFTRHSDIEKECVLYKESSGVWLDSFYTKEWLTEKIILEHRRDKKMMGIISPEIHGYDYTYMWNMLKRTGYYRENDIMLCTDFPNKAKEFFGL